jgi:histidinol-phosphatase (PHP family)
MQLSNYHSHTSLSDGHCLMEDIVSEAIKQNLVSMGFSEHSPVPFHSDWNMKAYDLTNYLNKAKELKTKYASQLEIYCGLELDYFEPYNKQIIELSQVEKLDYTIGSVHYMGFFADGEAFNIDNVLEKYEQGIVELFNNDPILLYQKYYEAVIKMIQQMQPTIIGHVDKIKMFNTNNRFFNESSEGYKKAWKQALIAAKEKGCIVELNTRGMYKFSAELSYPSSELLHAMRRMEIPVTVNSDCHKAEEVVKGFDLAFDLLKDAGYTEYMQLRNGKWLGYKIL